MVHLLSFGATLVVQLVLTAPAADEGFVRLFPGDSLSGWVEEQHSFFKRQHPKQHTWSVKQGVVGCDGSLGNCGFLRYEKPLANFVLRLEYCVPQGCNSGVGIRARVPYTTLNPNTLPSNVGFEVQILDDACQPASKGSSGAFYGVLTPQQNAARPAGQWNQLEIDCRGPRIRVTLNGQRVQDVDQTKIRDIAPRPLVGYLSLQNHGGSIRFRNVRLKELTAAKPAAQDRWEPQIQAFEAADRQAPPQPGGVVFYGSSTIRMWKLAESFPTLHAINRGFGGAQYADCVRYVERAVIPCRPQTVVLYAGENDVAAGKMPTQVVADFRCCVQKLRTALPQVRILVFALKPSIKRWTLIDSIRQTNTLLRQVAERELHLIWLDAGPQMLGADGRPRADLFLRDGLHMNAEGYRRWTSLLVPYLTPETCAP